MKKIAALLALSLMLGGYSSHAQTSTNLFYDANSTTSGIGGSGNWTTTGASWTTSAAGTATTISGGWTNSAAWTNNNANNAILQGTPGTISLSSSSVYANQILVNTTGFTIQNSSTSSTTANRYFQPRNGIILAENVNLNISSGITTNGAITGFEGVITNAPGANNVSVTITGTTLNPDSAVRIGLDAARDLPTGSKVADWFVPVVIATTGNGYASIRSVGSSPNLWGSVTVNNGSRLIFGGGTNSTASRELLVRGNVTATSTSDFLVNELADNGTVVFYGTNTFGGRVVLQAAKLGYASVRAFGGSLLVLRDNTSFGQYASIGDQLPASRTITNPILIQGAVTLGLGNQGNYFGGNIDLDGGTRSVTVGNSTFFAGRVTNGSLQVANPSATRTFQFDGGLSLTSLSWTQGIVSLDSSKTNTIGTLTMNGQASSAPTLFIQNPATNSSISTGGALVFSGTNNSISFSNNNTLPSGTYTLLQGTSLDTNSLSQGGLTFKVVVITTGTNTATNTFALNGSPVSWQRYTYAFSNTATALVASLTAASPDIGWNGGTGNWNTDPNNQPWILDGISTSFRANDNVSIGTEGTLNVDSGGVTAGLVTISGFSNSVIQGGALTAASLMKNGAGTNTLASATTLTQGLTVNDGLMVVSAPLSYTNDTIIAGGTLETSGNEMVPDSSSVRLTSSSSTFRLGGNETVGGLAAAFGSSINLQQFTLRAGGNNTSFTNGATITGTGGIVKNGTGIMYMNQSGSTYSGGFTLNNGEVVFTSSGAGWGTNGAVTNSVFGSGTLTLNGGTVRSSSDTSGRTINNDVVINGDITFGSNSAAATITFSTNAGKFTTLTKDVTITNVGSVTWEQSIVGSGFRLTKAGVTSTNSGGATNLITFRASNDIAGMTITGGTVGYKNRNAFGGGTLIVSDGVTLGQDGNINNQLTTNDVTDRAVPNELRLNGNITFGLGGTANYWGGNIDFSGGNRTITLGNTTFLCGAITNGGQLILDNGSGSGTRTLSLYGVNTYSGGTVVRTNAALAVGHNQALGNGDLTFTNTSGSGVAILRAATLSTNATQVRTLANNINLASGMTVTLDSVSSAQDSAGNNISVAVDMVLSGNISGGGGLTKSSSNTVTLRGAKTYTGATAVQGGTLVNVISNLTATITTNTLSVVFSNTPVENGDYPILPGALTGSYSPASTSISSDQIISLNNGGSSQPAFVTVASKLSQTITGLATNDTKTFGALPYTLNVTKGASTSSLTFVSDNTGVATVSSAGLVTIVGAGSTTIRVNQAGDDNYLAASEVTQVLTVTAASQAAVSGSLGSSTVDFGGTTTVTASGGAGTGAYEFRQNGGTGAVSFSGTGTTRTINTTTAGTAEIEVRRLGDANYTDSSWVSAGTLTVNAPTPTGPTLTSAYPNSTPLGVNPQNGLTYLMSYALGGDSSNAPTLPSQVDEAGKLALVAVVRTNDTNVSVVGEAVGSLADYANPSSITAVNGTTNYVTQTNLPAGCERRKYSVDQGSNDRQFLRLKAIQK